jgi:hypothetical protein
MTASTSKAASDPSQAWPALPFAEWKETYATLHMWSQIVGKVRLALSPSVNHWWETPFYVTARGLTTSPIPSETCNFEIDFDFIAHTLAIVTSRGVSKIIPLAPRTVADFYQEFMATLRGLGITVKIWPMPVEIPNPIRFDQDRIHASYDPEYANRFWRILVTADFLFKQFRSNFIGKVSPVHFFWGSFDLCVTRFSGRRAPERPGADLITREAYSHEAAVRPAKAFYSTQLNEFLLMYDDARACESPEKAVLDFCQSTYEAAAMLGRWDRESLERPA